MPSGNRSTVQPVAAASSVQWPTLTPSIGNFTPPTLVVVAEDSTLLLLRHHDWPAERELNLGNARRGSLPSKDT